MQKTANKLKFILPGDRMHVYQLEIGLSEEKKTP